MKSSLVFDYRESPFKKSISFLLIICLMLQFNGCYYYRAVIPAEPPVQTLQSELDGSYIMLHCKDEDKVMRNIEFERDKVTCSLVEPVGHEYYKDTKRYTVNRYRMNTSIDESEVLNEVHLYVDDYTILDDQRISIPLDKIVNVVLYNPAIGATTLTWSVGGGIIGTASLYALALVIVLLTSCPFVYTFDGTQYAFNGEIYGGAIFPGLERHDYLPLPSLIPVEDQYQLLMANELPEIQNTNLAELLYVDHQAGMKLLFDKYGKLQSINNSAEASSISNLDGLDIKNELLKKDNILYYGADLDSDPDIVDGIIIESNKPAEAGEMKIVISARNSFWLEYVYKNFHELLGTKYQDYTRKNSELSKEEMIQKMLDQQLPISVYIEKDGKWIFSDYFNMVGPMAFKDDVLSLDVSDLPAGPVKVKLEYGSYFWELDYAAIDFSENPEMTIGEIPVFSATDETGKDVSLLLNSDDNQYYIQAEKGNAADIRFPVPEMTDESRSLFLHSKGYYKILRDPRGLPDSRKLQELKEGDGLPQYSLELMLQFEKQGSSGFAK